MIYEAFALKSGQIKTGAPRYDRKRIGNSE